MIKDLNFGYYYILSLIIFHHYLTSVYLWTPYCRDLEVGQLGVDCRRAQPNGPKGSLGIFDNMIPFDAVPSWFEGCGVSRAGGTSISSAPPMRPSGGTPMVNVCLSHVFDYLNSNTKTRDKPTIIYQTTGIHR